MEDSSRFQGVVCPFHLAVLNPENAIRPGAPAPGQVGERNSLMVLYRHARFHAGFDAKSAFVTMLVGILGGKKWAGVLRNAATWSYDPAELADSILNKHPQNSGMISRSVPGGFVDGCLERLLRDFGSSYTPVGKGSVERGVSLTELDVFLDIVAAETPGTKTRRRLGRTLANAELPFALRAWGTESVSGVRYLGEQAIVSLFRDHHFPSWTEPHSS